MANHKTDGDTERAARLLKKLAHQPEVLDRIERILEVVENETGEALTADEAEELLVQELRLLGHDALQSWADTKNRRVERDYEARRDTRRHEKKGSTGRPASGH